MTDRVRSDLKRRVGEQSGFLSPILTVFFLAVLGVLPEEKEKEKPKKEPVKALSATVTLESGEQIDAMPEEGVSIFRRMAESGTLRTFLEQMEPLPSVSYYGPPEPVWGRDEYGRMRVMEMETVAPPIHIDPGTEAISRIIELYFGQNPFYEYPYRVGVRVERRSHIIMIIAVTEPGIRFAGEHEYPMGQIDMLRNTVGYCDPNTGRVVHSVPLAEPHRFDSGYGQALRREMNYMMGGYPSGYCTPHRSVWTGPRNGGFPESYGDCD